MSDGGWEVVDAQPGTITMMMMIVIVMMIVMEMMMQWA
jgi:hypothetical protein